MNNDITNNNIMTNMDELLKDPNKYSIMTMGGSYSEFVRGGIQYRILETDNIEMFADRGIYVGVTSSNSMIPLHIYMMGHPEI